MGKDKTRSLEWGSANRPITSNKLGTPNPSEGGDGDIQIRQTQFGAKLFAKIGGIWTNAILSTQTDVLSIRNNKGQKTISLNADGTASFGSSIDVGSNIKITGHKGLLDFQANNQNILIGNSNNKPLNALTDHADWSDNIAIGDNVMASVTTVTNNVCIGNNAMGEMVGGVESNSNVAIGVNALQGTNGSNTRADGNVAVGPDAMYICHIGDQVGAYPQFNVAVGRRALSKVNGDYNIGIGYQTGDLVEAGSYNILIGYDAGDNITDGSNNVIIGGVDAPVADGDDQLVIASGNDGHPTWITGDTNGVYIRVGSSTSAASGFNTASNLFIDTKHDSIVDDNVLGTISFMASDETGTDAKLPGATIWAEAEGTFDASNNPTALCFSTASSETSLASANERMRINKDGNIGIGTNDPKATLHIASIPPTTDAEIPALGDSDHSTGFIVSNDDPDYGTLIGTKSDGKGWIQVQRIDGTGTAYSLLLQPNDGKVGIGTDDPPNTLSVFATYATSHIAQIYNESTNANADVLYLKIARSATPETTNNYITFNNAGGTLDEMEGDGSSGIRFTGTAHSTYGTSDSRIKTNIADLDSALDKINSLKPRTFDFTDEYKAQSFQTHSIKDWQKTSQVGFVSQEFKTVFPELVETNKRQVNIDSVTYDDQNYSNGDMVEIEVIEMRGFRFEAYLVKAIQELSAKVTALENN